MRLIAFIMAVMIFSGAMPACGISDLCCKSAENATLDISTDKQQKEDSSQEEDCQCCALCIHHAPSYCTVIALPTADDVEINQQINTFVLSYAHEFHLDVWQPPRCA